MPGYRIGRLKGRFVVTWIDAGGVRRRHRLAAATVRAAEAEGRELIRRVTQPAGGATVADLWHAYREDRAGRPVAETMRWTGIAVLAQMGALRPDQIDTAACRRYARLRAAAGIRPGSVWTEMGHLRTVMNWAAKTGRIARAPQVERPQKPAPRDRWLTHDEIDRLLAAEAAPHVRLAILLLLGTAGRIGAVLDLTWDRVDLARGRIDLRRDAIGPRKGRAVVPVNGMLRAALTTAREAALTDHVVEYGGALRALMLLIEEGRA